MRTASPSVRRLVTAGGALIWVAAAVATHLPASTYAGLDAGDSALHFFGYLILGAVFLVTLRVRAMTLRWRMFLGLPILLVYGALDEITQPLVGRHGAMADWLANAVGIFAAGAGDLLLATLQRKWARTKSYAAGKRN